MKVVDFGTNQKRVCDFLLVITSSLRPILHRFPDMLAYVEKSPKSPVRIHPGLINRPRSWWPLSNFGMNQVLSEIRMFMLSKDEEIIPLAFFVLSTDRRINAADGRAFLLYQRLHSLICYRAGKKSAKVSSSLINVKCRISYIVIFVNLLSVEYRHNSLQ